MLSSSEASLIRLKFIFDHCRQNQLYLTKQISGIYSIHDCNKYSKIIHLHVIFEVSNSKPNQTDIPFMNMNGQNECIAYETIIEY